MTDRPIARLSFDPILEFFVGLTSNNYCSAHSRVPRVRIQEQLESAVLRQSGSCPTLTPEM